MHITFRPIDAWPGVLRTAMQRESARFTASWSDTLDVLDRELYQLAAKNVVLELAMSERDIRRDGLPRADARQPEHPGVIISFDSKHGPLRYFTDMFHSGGYRPSASGGRTVPGWQANVRAIALGLEALRKVDRYGITSRAEQYRGFNALGSGMPMPAATMSSDDAAWYLVGASDWCEADSPGEGVSYILDHEDAYLEAYRFAAKALHPDAGGTTEQFQRLQDAKRVLDAHHGRAA